MKQSDRQQLEHQVIVAAREYGISTTLFRNAVGEQLGVNVTDMECLALLFFKGIASPTELGRYTGLSSGATTAMLDRLEKAKLIIRQPNPADRRGILIKVDPRSKQTVGPLFAGVRNDQTALLQSYDDHSLALITDFLRRYGAVWEANRQTKQK